MSYRRIKQFFGKRKFSRLNKKILELQKYSLICFVRNSAVPVSGEEGLIELFSMYVKQAWDISIKLGGLVVKFLKKFGMSYPWMSVFGVFISCALLLLHYLAKKFGKKLKHYDYLLVIILSLTIVCLLCIAIKAEAFKTILEWIKSILVTIFLALRNINSSLTKHTEDLQSYSSSIEDKSEPSKASNFKTFVFFFVLTTRCLLVRFKRKLVGDSPFRDIIIEIIDNDTLSLSGFPKSKDYKIL